MVIYRKYRPQIFADLSGQENIIKILKGAIKRKNIGHAYLFSGPRGVGKTTVARILAKAVNCENLSKDFEPCGKCRSCLEITSGASLDFTEIDAASNRGIDEIRQLREGVNFAPAKNLYKVIILDEIHMLTKEAFNAFLKTLEEPPERTIFILATTEIYKLPATIISRCQRFDFSRISVDKIVKHLEYIIKQENVSAEKVALEMIATNCGGCLRDTLSFLEQMLLISPKNITLADVQETLGLPDQKTISELAEKILQKNTMQAIQSVGEILDGGKDLSVFVSSLIVYFRGLLMLNISDELSEILSQNWTQEELNKMRALTRQTTRNDLTSIMRKLIEAQDKMKFSDFPHVYLEMAIAESTVQNGLTSEEKNDKNTGEGDGSGDGDVTEKNQENIKNQPNNNACCSEISPEQWNEILSDIKKKNHSVHAFLSACSPVKILDNDLLIFVKHQFHKERLNTQQNKILIESAISSVMGNKLTMRCFFKDELEKMGIEVGEETVESMSQNDEIISSESGDVISEALEMFGGSIINEQCAISNDQ